MAVEVDGAGEAGAVLQGEVQSRDAVHRDKNAKTQGRESLFEDFMNEIPSLSEQAQGTAAAENKKAT